MKIQSILFVAITLLGATLKAQTYHTANIGSLQSNTDANALLGYGTYDVVTGNGTGNVNYPPGYYQYGNLINFGSANFGTQFLVSNQQSGFYLRTRYGTTYTPWVRVWTTGDYTSANFLPLTGGVLTGTLTLTGGNVGIGTTTPATALHVLNNTTSLAGANFITLDNRGSNAQYTTTHVVGGLLFSGYRDVRSPANIAGIWAVRSSACGGLCSQGDIVFGTNATNNPMNIAQDATLPVERMRINYLGNVGINNSSPLTPLDVNGTVRSPSLISNVSNITDQFTHNGMSFNNYGITWVTDSWQSAGPTAWLSSWGGMKLFTGGQNRVNITFGGNVGIGTATPSQLLEVNGNILSAGNVYIGGGNGITVANTTGYALAVNGSAIFTKAVVKLSANWPDFVFEPTYKLTPLNKVEEFIQANHHLPGIEPAAQMQKEGVDVGSNQAKLLQKIEELTLYVIEEHKKNSELNKTVEAQSKLLAQLLAEVEKLKKADK